MNKEPKPKLPAGVEIHGANLRVSFTYQHIRCRESIGLRPTKQNIKFAAGKLAAIKHEIATGTFNYAEHFPKSKNIIANGEQKNKAARIDDLIEQFLTSKVDIRKSTLSRYRSSLFFMARIYGASRTSKTLSKITVTRLRNEIAKNRKARASNSYLTCLIMFLKWVFEQGYTREDLSLSIKKVKAPSLDIEPFSIDEYKAVINSCHYDQHKNMITILAYTGIRIGELCGLAWQDIDFDNATMRIFRAVSTLNEQKLKTTKTDNVRTVYLLPPALAALKSQFSFTGNIPAEVFDIELSDKSKIKEALSFVFVPSITKKTSSKFCSEAFISNTWIRLSKTAGIKHRRAYQWRHTYASWMLTAGVNPSYLAVQMGHANFQMIASIYAKWMSSNSPSEHKRAVDQLKSMGHIAPFMPQEKNKQF